MTIQLVLIVGVVAFAALSYRGRNRPGHRAMRRVALLVFCGVALVAVIEPALVTWLANRVGVGRGTDLLVYGLVFAFLFTTLSLYAKFQETDNRMVELARAIALDQATRTDKIET